MRATGRPRDRMPNEAPSDKHIDGRGLPFAWPPFEPMPYRCRIWCRCWKSNLTNIRRILKGLSSGQFPWPFRHVSMLFIIILRRWSRAFFSVRHCCWRCRPVDAARSRARSPRKESIAGESGGIFTTFIYQYYLSKLSLQVSGGSAGA